MTGKQGLFNLIKKSGHSAARLAATTALRVAVVQKSLKTDPRLEVVQFDMADLVQRLDRLEGQNRQLLASQDETLAAAQEEMRPVVLRLEGKGQVAAVSETAGDDSGWGSWSGLATGAFFYFEKPTRSIWPGVASVTRRRCADHNLRLLCYYPPLFLLWHLASPSHARAQIPSQRGKRIEHVCDLPDNSPLRNQSFPPDPGNDAAAALRRTQNPPTSTRDMSIGFKYEYSGVLWLTLSTSKGQYVLYRDKWYLPLGADEKEVAEKAWIPQSVLSKPWSYRFPVGWRVVGVVMVVMLIGRLGVDWFHSYRQRLVLRLLVMPAYQQAVRMVANGADVSKAADFLVSQGVPFNEAQINLKTILEAIESKLVVFRQQS